MKEINNTVKKNFFKRIFIKICRVFGYEIIDQSNFYVPTQEKSLNENLNIQGNKSIILPLGETKVSRNRCPYRFKSEKIQKGITKHKYILGEKRSTT